MTSPLHSSASPLIGVVMGSDSDWRIMSDASQVLTDFGNGGSLSLSYTRPMEPSCAGNVRDQFHAQVALSLRRPLLVGHAAHDCPAGGGSDWLLARIDHPFDRIFADGFEP